MNWKEYLKSIGHTDAEISQMETTFGADKMAKAFETPLREKAAAMEAAAQAKRDKEEFDRFYNEDVLPKVSGVYQDAINQRTRAAALEARLAAAREYGFLSEGADGTVEGTVPGSPGGTPVRAGASGGVPGSPSLPPGVTQQGQQGQPAMDSRYVSADAFARELTNVPAMLGRLTKMSNEHFSLFGQPLLDVDELITAATTSKRNVVEVWREKYKVDDKRKEIETKRQADHDKQVGEEALRKYLTEHGQPFTRPPVPSIASRFTPKQAEDARHPWKGAGERKVVRRNALLDAVNGTAVSKSVN